MKDKLLYDFNNIGGKIAVVISHGFGSSKESPTAVSMAEELCRAGISSIRFDFPAHGSSPLDGEHFRIEECLDHIAEAERIVSEALPEAEICYFSSSFGAYMNLIYLAKRPHRGRKSFLRCTAADMPGIMRCWVNPFDSRPFPDTDISPYDAWKQLKTDGYVMFSEGYERPLKITSGFFEDLEENNLFKIYEGKKPDALLRMIHGSADETAPYADARAFAEMTGTDLITVDGADHRFTPPGAMDRVRREAVRFYTESESAE